MSQEGVNNNTPASPAANLIPKERLDELIAQVRQTKAENDGLRNLVQSLVPKPQAAEPKDSPRLQKMKEEDPELYSMIKGQEQKTRRLNATVFAQNELIDKKNLIDTVGLDKANANFQEIERIMDTARKSGNFQMTRVEAYLLLRGQAALQSERQAPNKPAYDAANAAPTPAKTSNDAPPSDIEAQGPTSSAARVSSGERDWDDWASKNANQEF